MIRRVCTVIGTLRWVKCPLGHGERGTPWNMKKSAVNHHKTHKSLRRPGARRSSVGVPVPGWRRGAVVVHGSGAPRAPRWLPFAPPGSLSCSLRRYVRPSSLRVWLMRRAAGAGRANALAGGSGPVGDAARQAGVSGEARSPLPRALAEAGRGPGTAHCRGTLAETDKRNIRSRLRQAFEEVFGAARLSLRESGRVPEAQD